MYKTPHIKRLTYSSIKNSPDKNKLNTENPTSFHSLHQSIEVNRKLEKHTGLKESDYERSLKEETKQVLKELSISSLSAIASDFESFLNDCFEVMNQKFIYLEFKIADLQRKFNSVELLLVKKSKTIKNFEKQNKEILGLNKDLILTIEKLKEEKTASDQFTYNKWMDAKIKSMKEEVEHIKNISEHPRYCEKNLREKIGKEFESILEFYTRLPNESQKYLTFCQNSLKEVIQTFTLPAGDYLQEKLLENIDLKFELLFLKQNLQSHNVEPITTN